MTLNGRVQRASHPAAAANSGRYGLMLTARKLPVAVELTRRGQISFHLQRPTLVQRDPAHTRAHPITDKLRAMAEKRLDNSTSRRVSDDPEDGTWAEIDCEAETGPFVIITDVLPPEAAPNSNGGESPNHHTLNDQFAIITDVLSAEAAPKPSTSGETPRRRTLDDMRRLSEEIKRKRQSGG